MLEIYLLSILIWAIILFCTIIFLGHKIIKNGWLDRVEPSTGNKGWALFFIISAIPIFRLLIASTIVYMSAHTRDEYEDIQNKYDEDE